MNCACGSNKTYENCCSLAHNATVKVKTAEQLMRSRYTAFTLADGDYLMESHHSSTRGLVDKSEIVSWANLVQWLRLEILSKSLGLENDTIGTVEFKAYFNEKGVERFIHENSKFVKENNCWVYLGFS
jgi:SEC-C motif-containing protein